MRGVGQAGAAQVVHVRLGPAGLAGVGHAVAQQEHAQLLLGARQRLHRVGARPAEVAHRVDACGTLRAVCLRFAPAVGGLGHVDALQLARAVEAGDLARVDPLPRRESGSRRAEPDRRSPAQRGTIGLHPLAGLLRDLGGRGDQAAVAQLLQPPREREAGRPRVIPLRGLCGIASLWAGRLRARQCRPRRSPPWRRRTSCAGAEAPARRRGSCRPTTRRTGAGTRPPWRWRRRWNLWQPWGIGSKGCLSHCVRLWTSGPT